MQTDSKNCIQSDSINCINCIQIGSIYCMQTNNIYCMQTESLTCMQSNHMCVKQTVNINSPDYKISDFYSNNKFLNRILSEIVGYLWSDAHFRQQQKHNITTVFCSQQWGSLLPVSAYVWPGHSFLHKREWTFCQIFLQSHLKASSPNPKDKKFRLRGCV